MAEIKAFKGLRYTEKAGNIENLCCPPYDIISDLEREKYIKLDDRNIIRLEKPRKDNQDDYMAARGFLNRWLSSGSLKNDDEDSIYIYEMSFDVDGEQYDVKGFISLVKLEDFSKGIILPHEETLSKAKTDRLNLLKMTGCNFSSIYSLYMDDNNTVFSLINNATDFKADVSFTDESGVRHKLWCVSDKAVIEKVKQAMAEKKLYIADGHHRYETALNYRNYITEQTGSAGNADYVMMMLVNLENPDLVIFPTHRVLHNLESFNYDKLIDKCSKQFSVEEKLTKDAAISALKGCYDSDKTAFVLYSGEEEYSLLVLKDAEAVKLALPNASDAIRNLDVTVLHSLILEPYCGIDKNNMANQSNLAYTRDVAEAIDAVNSGEANCTFLLNPTRVSEIRDVALHGEKMPQKSTYFYPKLITGLVMNQVVSIKE